MLTAFITGLSIGSACAQSSSPLFSQRSGETNPVFWYDSTEVAKIAEIILENEMLRKNEELYIQKDSLQNINRIILDEKINSLKEIIRLKDEQLIKLEKSPLPIIDKSWKWWQYTLAAIGAITFGFTAGVIYGSGR